jgi:hypothetical protein
MRASHALTFHLIEVRGDIAGMGTICCGVAVIGIAVATCHILLESREARLATLGVVAALASKLALAATLSAVFEKISIFAPLELARPIVRGKANLTKKTYCRVAP